MPDGQVLQVPLSTIGRLTEPQEFAELIIKKTADDRIVRLKDVARIELGPKNQDISCSVNGKPSVTLAIFQLPDANALDTADIVKAKIRELEADFPPGMQYEIRYDTTPFISESIYEVFKTLRDAVILVAVVVLLFLPELAIGLDPPGAVPVAIVGTFAVMAAMGFSLNNLTLFGLVLAIGIVVDDAIVVVEAVEHHVEHGMEPRAATIRAMDEVSGPVIAIGLVLTAVFVPCAFITGIVGQFFRQFALTIATSTVISAFNSLTLSPALAAILIKPKSDGPRVALPRLFYALLGGFMAYFYAMPYLQGRMGGPAWLPLVGSAVAGALAGWVVGWPLDKVLGWFFGVFNASFRLATKGYSRLVSVFLRGSVAALIIYGGLIYLTYHTFVRTPAGFIPTQDMGYLLANVQLSDSVSLERTKEVMDRCERIAKATPGIKHTQAMTGQSLLLSANGSNFGSMFCILDSFEHRRSKELYSEAIIAKLRKDFARLVPEATIAVLGPPPVRGIGRAGGFKLMVEDRGDNKSQILQGQTDALLDKARNIPRQGSPVSPQGVPTFPRLTSMVSTFRANVPQFFVDVNRSEALSKQVSAEGPLRHTPDLPRLALRQRHQPFRPDLARWSSRPTASSGT